MPQTVSQQIYARFFEELASLDGVKPETIAALKTLQANNRLGRSRDLANLVRGMEERYARDQDTDG